MDPLACPSRTSSAMASGISLQQYRFVKKSNLWTSPPATSPHKTSLLRALLPLAFPSIPRMGMLIGCLQERRWRLEPPPCSISLCCHCCCTKNEPTRAPIRSPFSSLPHVIVVAAASMDVVVVFNQPQYQWELT